MVDASAVPRQRALLIIMDGVGLNPSRVNNAVAEAHTPNLDKLYSSNPTTVLEASGRPVGLPDGQMGNSEVGHLTIGCGSVLRQDLVRINDAIESGAIQDNVALNAAIKSAQNSGRPLHLIGLVSDGGIHSHIDHLIALIALAGSAGVVPLLHFISDGRDTAPQGATRFVKEVQGPLAAAGGGIASVCGRYYAMDRDQRWERIEQAWQLFVNGVGTQASTAENGIEAAWAEGVTDEFIQPIVLPDFQPMQADDEVVFFNFRNDRPRQLSEALADPTFSHFQRSGKGLVSLTTLTRYQADYSFPVLFEKEVPDITLGQVVSEAGIAQLRSAETEKYPHVTYFFNGGREEPFPGEERLLVNSPSVATYDLQPEMSARQVMQGIHDALCEQKHGLIVVNFANCDMVGHTGVGSAVIQAVEVVDEMVGKLCQCAQNNNYSVVLTADHGNADMLVDPVTGAPHTQHTTFPVACTIIDKDQWHLANGFGLPAIAPTLLQLMGLPQPASMTGRSVLLEKLNTT